MRSRRWRIDGAAQQNPIAQIKRCRHHGGDRQRNTNVSDSDRAVRFIAIEDHEGAADRERRNREQAGVFRTHRQTAEGAENRPLLDVFCVKANACCREHQRCIYAVHEAVVRTCVNGRHGSYDGGDPPSLRGLQPHPRRETSTDQQK
jgi:hypothetical protein